MEALEYAVRAYRLLMFLVQVILDAFFGNVFVGAGLLLAVPVAALGFILYRRRRGR